MTNVVIYTKKTCSYCSRAKSLLDKKGIAYTVLDITNDDSLRSEMIQKSGNKRTVPQIFINDKNIGGFDDLNILDKKGELDNLLDGIF
jgi:glutaredoxin 3